MNNIKARSSSPVSPVGSGSLTDEVFFSESLWILESQKSLLLNQNFKQQCAQLGVIRDMNGILRCKGRLCHSSLPETAKFPFASTGVDFAGPLFVKSVFGKELQGPFILSSL